MTLTTVSLLAAHLTAENHQELLDMVRHKSKRQVEELVARLRPQPPIPTSIRRLPTARPAAAPLELATATRSGPSSATLPPDPPSPVRTRPRRTGRRCTECGFLEFHHVLPYAAGGQATGDNIQLRCRSHNGFEAELYFGPATRSTPRRSGHPTPTRGRSGVGSAGPG